MSAIIADNTATHTGGEQSPAQSPAFDESASSAFPRLRTDLVIVKTDVQGECCYRIKVPDHRDYFQVRETEYLIMSLMDGGRSIDDICAAASEEHDLLIDPPVVSSFVTALEKAGCLENSTPQLAERSKKNSLAALSRNILYLNVHLFNPDRFLTRFLPAVGFFFSWPFFALNAVATVVAIGVLIANGGQFFSDITNMNVGTGFVMLYLSAAIATAIHELGHGFACKHFGGEVPSMGALLILAVIPCFYTDVSDAWLFRHKRQRLWVTAAGVIIESAIWSLAVFVWLYTQSDSLIHQMALAVIISSGIGILLTLNPLLKFDGYYLISDALDIPNLRDKAMAYFSIWLGTLLDGGKDRLPKVSRRNARVFKIYGFAALAITFLILGNVLARLTGAASLYWGNIFVLPVLYLGWILLGSTFKGIWAGIHHKPAVNGTPAEPQAQTPAPAGSGSSPTNSTDDDTMETQNPSPEGPRQRSKWRRPLIILGVIAVLLTVSELMTSTLEIDGPVTFRPQSHQSIEPRVQGFIAEVFVREGSQVEAGEPLLKLDDGSLRLALQSVETELANAEYRLSLLQKGPKQEVIDARLATIDMIKGDIAHYRTVYDQIMKAPDVINGLQILDAQFQLEQAEHRLNVAEREFDALVSPPQQEELDALLAQIANLNARREKHLSDIEKAVIRAPIDGVVVTRMPESLVGRLATTGNTIIDIEDNQAYTALISIHERDASLIALDQRVELKVFGYPHRVFEGNVTHIAATLDSSTINGQPTSTITVEARIDDPERLIKTGMGGIARVFTEEQSYRDILFRKFTSWFRVAFWW